MATKPQLSFWHIWNMSFGFLGIQFGFAWASILSMPHAILTGSLPVRKWGYLIFSSQYFRY